MDSEFAVSLATRMAAAVPIGVVVAEADVAYAQGGPNAGTVTFSVEYLTGNLALPLLLDVAVDVDIWTRGPARSEADEIASALENALIGWEVVTARQGTVRLNYHQRVPVPSPEDRLAHVSMRFTGRAFRRLEP